MAWSLSGLGLGGKLPFFIRAIGLPGKWLGPLGHVFSNPFEDKYQHRVIFKEKKKKQQQKKSASLLQVPKQMLRRTYIYNASNISLIFSVPT